MRVDFTSDTKEKLAKRVGYRCSNPQCRQATSGPQDDPDRVVNIGVAAHITAAAPGGPRYDASLTDDERCSQENGIWLCQNHAKLVDNDISRFPVEQLRKWKRNAEDTARRELEAPIGGLDQRDLSHEQLRARLAIAVARLKRPLEQGITPEVEFHLVNMGNSTAERITHARTGMLSPAEILPKWELSDFDEISAAHGSPPPKRDTFYSTSVEPRLGKSVTLPFLKVGVLLEAMSPAVFQNLGVRGAAQVGENWAQRIFFFGYFEYETLGKTYRLKFCYTPRSYEGVKLVEGPQWNGTEEIGVEDSEGRAERRVVADIALLDVKLSTSGAITDSSALSLQFFNFGPTPASNVCGAYRIAIERSTTLQPDQAMQTLPAGAIFETATSPPLKSIFGVDCVKELLAGTRPLVIDSLIVYDDVWGINHRKRFVSRFNAPQRRFDTSEILYEFRRGKDDELIECEVTIGGKSIDGCSIRFSKQDVVVSERGGFANLPQAKAWANAERQKMERRYS